jgi:xylono-1,5-lactonase
MAPGADISCIWPAGAVLGEGPLWDERDGALYWVDIKAPAAHRLHPAGGGKTTWPMPEMIGCMAKRRRGGFVAAFQSGFAFIDPARGKIERIGNPEPELQGNRFNDGKCDRAGRFWAGSMDDALVRPTGWLYRLDHDLSWERVDGGYVCTNGPAFSPDGRTMYHADSHGKTVYAYDLSAAGQAANKRVFARFGKGEGVPDGMTTDTDGCLWVCHWDGWRITRFRPDGKVDRVIPMPVARVTSCAFGGPDFDVLYVTSASTGLDAAALARQPLAGGLFALRPGVRGLPEPDFAG